MCKNSSSLRAPPLRVPLPIARKGNLCRPATTSCEPIRQTPTKLPKMRLGQRVEGNKASRAPEHRRNHENLATAANFVRFCPILISPPDADAPSRPSPRKFLGDRQIIARANLTGGRYRPRSLLGRGNRPQPLGGLTRRTGALQRKKSRFSAASLLGGRGKPAPNR